MTGAVRDPGGAVGVERPAEHLHLLLRLDRVRFAGTFRRPTVALGVAATLPVLVVGSALWMVGRVGAPGMAGVSGAVTLGLFVSGPIAFMAYGILFGGGDDAFLRRLGISPRAFMVERCLRLLIAAVVTALALTLPFVAAGVPALGALLVTLSGGLAATGAAAVAFGWAARVSALGGGSLLSVGIKQWDPGLARAAPLVYAPLLPFLLGGGYAGIAGMGGIGAGLATAGGALLGALGILVGSVLFAPAAPRFFPRVREMAYTPPPEGEGEGFRVGRGLSALLPRRSAAVWVRDATVAGRRFAWAARVTWPVAIVSIAALARWGDAPATRVWVLVAVGFALMVQGAAVIGLGGMERCGTRWLDRSGGLAWWERFLGRWAWAWGLSLWLLVPVALAWQWWSGVGGAWIWPAAGAAVAAASVAVSLLNAERR